MTKSKMTLVRHNDQKGHRKAVKECTKKTDGIQEKVDGLKRTIQYFVYYLINFFNVTLILLRLFNYLSYF